MASARCIELELRSPICGERKNFVQELDQMKLELEVVRADRDFLEAELKRREDTSLANVVLLRDRDMARMIIGDRSFDIACKMTDILSGNTVQYLMNKSSQASKMAEVGNLVECLAAKNHAVNLNNNSTNVTEVTEVDKDTDSIVKYDVKTRAETLMEDLRRSCAGDLQKCKKRCLEVLRQRNVAAQLIKAVIDEDADVKANVTGDEVKGSSIQVMKKDDGESRDQSHAEQPKDQDTRMMNDKKVVDENLKDARSKMMLKKKGDRKVDAKSKKQNAKPSTSNVGSKKSSEEHKRCMTMIDERITRLKAATSKLPVALKLKEKSKAYVPHATMIPKLQMKFTARPNKKQSANNCRPAIKSNGSNDSKLMTKMAAKADAANPRKVMEGELRKTTSAEVIAKYA